MQLTVEEYLCGEQSVSIALKLLPLVQQRKEKNKGKNYYVSIALKLLPLVQLKESTECLNKFVEFQSPSSSYH